MCVTRGDSGGAGVRLSSGTGSRTKSPGTPGTIRRGTGRGLGESVTFGGNRVGAPAWLRILRLDAAGGYRERGSRPPWGARGGAGNAPSVRTLGWARDRCGVERGTPPILGPRLCQEIEKESLLVGLSRSPLWPEGQI